MKYRFIGFFIVFSLLFLFYPGDSYYFHIFAYNRSSFQQKKTLYNIQPALIPYLPYETSPDISAEGVYIVDLPSFTPLFERNSKEKFFPASTTKILTALVVNDLYKPDDVLIVKEASIEGQIMNLVPGEKIIAENLLYGILVHSANDAAYAFANNVGYNTFIRLMNEKAKFFSDHNC